MHVFKMLMQTRGSAASGHSQWGTNRPWTMHEHVSRSWCLVERTTHTQRSKSQSTVQHDEPFHVHQHHGCFRSCNHSPFLYLVQTVCSYTGHRALQRPCPSLTCASDITQCIAPWQDVPVTTTCMCEPDTSYAILCHHERAKSCQDPHPACSTICAVAGCANVMACICVDKCYRPLTPKTPGLHC